MERKTKKKKKKLGWEKKNKLSLAQCCDNLLVHFRNFQLKGLFQLDH